MQTEKSKLYENVDFCRDLFGIPFDQPIMLVDILSLYARCDVEYCNFKTPGLCGVAMVGDKMDTIVLNTNRSPEEQNFDCGHEFIHLTEHRHIQDSFNCFTKAKPQQNTFHEWQANEGSAQFLVPYQDFIPRFSHLFSLNCGDIVSALAEHYYVTTQVINIRLDSLSYEIDQYRAGTPLSQLELLSRNQRRRRGITTTCYSALCDFPLDFDDSMICCT